MRSSALLALLLLLLACNPRIEEYEERGDRYSATGDYVDARVEYELAIEEAGEDPPAGLRFKAGALALRAKDFGEANRLFARLIEERPDEEARVAGLYKLHAHRWAAGGDTFAALQAVDWLMSSESSPDLGSLWFTLGDAEYRRPDYDAAIAAYLAGLATASERAAPEVYARLGDAYERRRQCAAAIDAFREYVRRVDDPDLDIGPVRYRMGTCAYRMAERAFDHDEWDAARSYVDLMMEIGEPAGRIDDAMLLLARIHERTGNREAAISMYERLQRRGEDDPSRAAIEAHRRLVQLDFGMPLRTADRVSEERIGSRPDGGERSGP